MHIRTNSIGSQPIIPIIVRGMFQREKKIPTNVDNKEGFVFRGWFVLRILFTARKRIMEGNEYARKAMSNDGCWT